MELVIHQDVDEVEVDLAQDPPDSRDSPHLEQAMLSMKSS